MKARFALPALLAFLPFVLLSPAIGGPSLLEEKARPDLRALVQEYVEAGDLEKAISALNAKKATPGQLLATLREPRKQDEEPKAGQQTLELEDGHGRKTDLIVVAPSEQQIKAHAKQGLGLVVLLHGLGGKAKDALPIAEALAATGDVVAVAPSAQPLPEGEGNEDGVPAAIAKNFKHWWLYDSPRSFPLEAIKKARSLYAIDPDRVSIGGASMGGFGTWNISLRRVDRFSAIAPIAGMLSRQFYMPGAKDEKSTSLLENGKSLPAFVAHGTADNVVPFKPDKEACDKLKELGGQVDFRALEGVAHKFDGIFDGKGEISLALMKHLTSHKRNPAPDAVTYVSVGDRLDGAFWLRVAKREKGAQKVRLEARAMRRENKIGLIAEGVELARVYLDERLLDLSKPVTVECGAKKTERKKVVAEFKAILESWRSRQDEKLVYPAYVEIDPRP
ncbi:hypothetical protein HY251_22295 [bacterium]|nr:hypothetical protein [bacterium]